MHCTCDAFLFQQNPCCTCRSQAAYGRSENEDHLGKTTEGTTPSPNLSRTSKSTTDLLQKQLTGNTYHYRGSILALLGFLWALPITWGNQVLMVGRGGGGLFPIHLFSFNENRFHPILNLFKWAGRIQSYASKLHIYCNPVQEKPSIMPHIFKIAGQNFPSQISFRVHGAGNERQIIKIVDEHHLRENRIQSQECKNNSWKNPKKFHNAGAAESWKQI